MTLKKRGLPGAASNEGFHECHRLFHRNSLPVERLVSAGRHKVNPAPNGFRKKGLLSFLAAAALQPNPPKQPGPACLPVIGALDNDRPTGNLL